MGIIPAAISSLGNTYSSSGASYGENFAGTMGTGAQAMAFNQAMMEAQQKFNAEEAQKNREWNSAEAQKTRDWQQEMSNTAYQRAMKDMQTAGLNPILAYQQGGASTPGGATGTGTAATSGMAQGVTDYTASGYQQSYNSAQSYSNWAHGLEELASSISSGFQSFVNALGLGGDNHDIGKAMDSFGSFAKEAFENASREISGMERGAGRYSQYNRYGSGREWK